MEKKKKLGFFYAASFLALLSNFVGDLVRSSSFAESWRFEAWYVFFQVRRGVPRLFLPTCILWLEWFLWDVLGSCFHTAQGWCAIVGPRLTQGAVRLWRVLFSCVGNRGLVGWRRVALKGFFTKLRFVTRYNYRRRGHYFWRRNQRRWRLFKTRRRIRFFIRRYRKFRRLRYSMSFQFAWRAQRRLEVLGLRWGGSAISLFALNFLRWRMFLLAQRRQSTATSRVFFWRRQTNFLAFRYRGFSKFRYQATVLQVAPSRKRLWYNRRTLGFGFRQYVPRDFRGLPQSVRAARKRPRVLSYSFRHLSNTVKKSSLSRERPDFSVVGVRKTRRRWRLLKRRRKRMRRIRRLVRQIPDLRYHIRHLWGSRTLRRKFRRRTKRRVKRRKKYAFRWTRTFLLTRRRRRHRGVHPFFCHLPVDSVRIRSRRLRFFGSLRSCRLTRYLPVHLSVRPLMHVVNLQVSWGRAAGKGLSTLTERLRLQQRRLSARHQAWDDEEAPEYNRLLYFRRWRTQKPFGRCRRWVASLFIDGGRHFYYRERKLPMVAVPVFSGNSLLGGSNVLAVAGARFRSAEVPVFRRRFWQRARGLFRKGPRLRRRRNVSLVDTTLVRQCRSLRQRTLFKRFRVGKRLNSARLLFRLRFGLFARFRRRVILRRSYIRTAIKTRFWFRTMLWRLRVLRLRFRLRKSVYTRRRVVERFLFRSLRRRFIFRLRFLQPGHSRVLVRRTQVRYSQVYRRGFSRQLRLTVRFGRLHRFIFQVRRRFRASFIKRLREQAKLFFIGYISCLVVADSDVFASSFV